MKIQVRRGVFETNSSSVHALALQKGFHYDCKESRERFKDIIPNNVILCVDREAGDGYDTFVQDKTTKKYREASKYGIVVNKIIHLYSQLVYSIIRCEEFFDYNGVDAGKAKRFSYRLLTRFLGYLNSLGIQYAICEETDESVYLYNTPLGYDKRGKSELEVVLKDEVSFCNFLFGDGSGVFSIETDSISDEEYDKFFNDLKKQDYITY